MLSLAAWGNLAKGHWSRVFHSQIRRLLRYAAKSHPFIQSPSGIACRDMQSNRTTRGLRDQPPEQFTTDSPSVISRHQSDIDQMESFWTDIDDHATHGNSVNLHDPAIRIGKLLAIASFLGE